MSMCRLVSCVIGRGSGCTLLFGCAVLSHSYDPIVCSLPGSSVYGVLQATILEWVAISFSICLHTCFHFFIVWLAIFPWGMRLKRRMDNPRKSKSLGQKRDCGCWRIADSGHGNVSSFKKDLTSWTCLLYSTHESCSLPGLESILQFLVKCCSIIMNIHFIECPLTSNVITFCYKFCYNIIC